MKNILWLLSNGYHDCPGEMYQRIWTAVVVIGVVKREKILYIF